MNQNPYNANPFQTSDAAMIDNAPNVDLNLSRQVFGLELMDTRNMREKVMTRMADTFDGVTGRWTYFTRLYGQQLLEQTQISTTVFAIDSKEELKMGAGRLFETKTIIGEREAIVSAHNLKSLNTRVGENVTLFYDIRLILNMV